MPSHRGVLILIQGLAGSGKSHLIQFLKYDFLIEENFAATDDSETQNITTLANNLRCGRRCIVSERKYRSQAERDTFIQSVKEAVAPQPEPDIRFICFENDPTAANHNCSERTNKPSDPCGKGHIKQNENDTEDYNIPDNAIVVKIHRI